TGIMLDLARVAGETAPLLFTAFGNRFWSTSWNQPVAALPLMIYTYALSAYDDWHRQAWAAGLILLLLVLATNIVARTVLARRSTAREMCTYGHLAGNGCDGKDAHENGARRGRQTIERQ